MNSFLKKFQDVVDMGKEEASTNALPDAHQSNLAASTDPAVLRRHIGTLTQQLARQVQSYEELREESTSIERELTRLRLRFVDSREMWDAVTENLEVVIQNLLEHQLYGNTATAKSLPAAGTSAAASADVTYTPLDTIYVASLHEQIQRLKEMVQRSGEERTQLRSEKQHEQAQLLMRSSGLATAAMEDDVRQALEKMMLHWQEERMHYEQVIESLEQHVAKHAEREALMSDEITQEKEQRQNAAATIQQQNSTLEELRTLSAELEEWRNGSRTLDASPSHPQQHTSTTLPTSAQPGQAFLHAATDILVADGADMTLESGGVAAVAAHRPAATPLADRSNVTTTTSPQPQATPFDSRSLASSAVDVKLLHEQQAELEQLRQDYGAREEALDSLYADNKNLQEALQRAEAQARQYDGELQECQRQLAEVQRQLTREQQRMKRLEEDGHKAAAAEAKLREQVRELRHALSAAADAASAAGQSSAVPYARYNVAGITIPQSTGVRVGQPARFEVAEQSITYEDGGTWGEWLAEGMQWWRELKGDAVPMRAPLTGSSHTGAGGVRRRAGLTARRGPRILLLFAGIVWVIMFTYLCIVFAKSIYSSLKNPDG